MALLQPQPPDVDELAEAALVRQPDPFPDYGLAEQLARPPKPYTVPGWWGPGDLVMLYAEPNAGKSLVMLDIAVRGALGLPIAGRFRPPHPINTLICMAEGIAGMSQRARAACGAHGLHEGTEAFTRIRFVDRVPALHAKEDSATGLDSFTGKGKALQEAGFHIDLVAIDTYSDAAAGADENSNADASVITARAALIARELGATVLLLHHSKKGGDDYRGASALKAKLDLMLEIAGTQNPRALRCVKSKDADRFHPIAFDIVPFGDSAIVRWSDVDAAHSLPKSAAARRHEDLIRTLRDRAAARDSALPVQQIHDAMQNPPSLPTLRSILTELSRDSKSAVHGERRQGVTSTGKPSNESWHYWLEPEEDNDA